MNNILEIGKRIRMRREELGMTQEELGKLLWLNKSTIQRYESGKFQTIKLPVLHAIAKQLDVDPNWIALNTNNKGSFCDQDQRLEGSFEKVMNLDSIYAQYDNVKPIRAKKIPLLGRIACGEPIYADEEHENYIMADTNINADFCLVAKGDSMINARIFDGDIVLIKKMALVNNGDIAAVIIDNEATLKRVYYYPDQSKLILNPENPSFEPLVYVNEELNTIRILGKAVCFMSSL